ncbi:MAG: trehalose-phosphatase [Frankiales bacterium]|nr:trehalose-phosphatase [Frankiales bacterium]
MLAPRTEAGRAGLAALRADPSRALVAVDYDGTLAPIVDDPAEAVPAPGAAAALRSLGCRVAVVTGRPALVAVELGGLADVPGLVVMGQYGVERWSGGSLTAAEPAPGLAQARDELPAMVRRVGAVLEDKGHSLVVHTRSAPSGALSRLAGPVIELGARLGLEVHPGRMVLELRPPGFDKRGALLALAEPLPSAVLFAGDDVGDGAAFDAVDELRARGVPGLTVFSDSAEGPDELRERADLVVDGPPGVVALLTELL